MTEFHFLRPWWLLALAPCVLVLWGMVLTQDPNLRWRSWIAPDLLPHLLVGQDRTRRVSPLVLLAVCWGLVILALSGPTWQHEPAPFGDDVAALAIVLKVTPSMLAEDVQPTRLARAVQKIHDLLQLRPGARTSLIAYAGSAHPVLPLTSDAAIVSALAGELAPGVMPKEGDEAAAALELADAMIARSRSRGWILWIADAVDAGQTAALQQRQASPASVPVTVFALCGTGPEQDSLVRATSLLSLPVVTVTPDDIDVRKLAANTRFSSSSEGMGERWQDSGYWLVPLIALICLGWFRRGWVLGDE